MDPKLLAAFRLITTDYATRDDAATAILDTIVSVYSPQQFGRDFDGLFKLPEPFESWDDKAATWLYRAVFDLLDGIDFNRDPDKIGDKAWRKARGLSRREQSAAALLLELTEGSVKGRAAVNVLVSLNRRELKRRDPVWCLRQALKHADDKEAKASIDRALARLEN